VYRGGAGRRRTVFVDASLIKADVGKTRPVPGDQPIVWPQAEDRRHRRVSPGPGGGQAKSWDRSVAGSAAPSSRRASWAASIVSPIERRPRTRGPQVISMRYAARSGGEAPHFGARPEGRARRSIPYLRYANIGVDGRQSPHTLYSSYHLQFIPFEFFTPLEALRQSSR
jgi:hypothetical protein